MKDYTRDVIKDVTNRYLQEVLVTPPESPEKLSELKIEARKRQARRIVEADMFIWACSMVINDAAQKIIKDADNDILRGKILGIGELIGLLNNWRATTSASDESQDREEAIKEMIKQRNGM